jgi:hypothetical protein
MSFELCSNEAAGTPKDPSILESAKAVGRHGRQTRWRSQARDAAADQAADAQNLATATLISRRCNGLFVTKVAIMTRF